MKRHKPAPKPERTVECKTCGEHLTGTGEDLIQIVALHCRAKHPGSWEVRAVKAEAA